VTSTGAARSRGGISTVAEDMKAMLRWDGEPVYVGAHAATTPDKAAVVMAESGETLSYREVDELANRASRLFRSLGLQVGDHIAICLENRPHYLPICIGAQYAGLYFTPISPRLQFDEVSYIFEDCGAQVFITSPARGQAQPCGGRRPRARTALRRRHG
jgi:acyl-CoA synthetase (AMP-forming)/AMP-acid ligase II